MSVPPNMMGAGPMIPPPPMGAPMGTPMGAPPALGGPIAPAVAALPGMADLAQAQTMQLAEHQRQMQMMQEEMQKQIMMLISSLPTPNPAGEAAVSTPMTPMMSGAGSTMGAPAAPGAADMMGGASSAH